MLIGRTKEIAKLNELYNGNEAELVAIYGRRRVGKTYLVDEVFSDKITFRHRGRILVRACGARSKKGRVIVEIERFR